jgi:enoyl-CoA hydratase
MGWRPATSCDTAAMAIVELEVQDRVALVTLNDPDRRNAVSHQVNAALVAVLDEVDARDDVGALVLTGQGPAFCAGAVLDDLAGCQSAEELRSIYGGFLRLDSMTVPTIAAVNGPAVGAGMNMALACDVILAGHSARFDTRFLQLGVHPGGGHTWRLERLIGRQAVTAMVLFGEVLDGDQAASRGLAWRCVDDETLLPAAKALAGHAATAPPELVQAIRTTLDRMEEVTDPEAAMAVELEPQWASMQSDAFKALVARMKDRISSRP